MAKNLFTKMDPQTFNVCILGLCCFVLFAGYNALSDIQKPLLLSAHQDYPDFNVDGFTFLGTLYASFAICIWFSPSIIVLLGTRLSMFLGAILYPLPPITIFLKKTWLLYAAGALNGFGSSILWTSTANYIIVNSSEKTLARNTGLFWIFYQLGMLPGNLFVYFAFQNTTSKIVESTRNLVLIGLAGIMIVGALMFLLIRPPPQNVKNVIVETPLEALKKAIIIFKSKNILILASAFGYLGLHLSFMSGVYGASIGFTLQFGEGVKRLVPLCSILIGLGEVFGGVMIRIFGDINCCKINLFYTLAVFGNVFTYIIVYVSLPTEANFGDTYDFGLIQPRIWLLLLGGFIFGIGDSFLNTQLYTVVGSLYPNDGAPAFSVFKFLRNVFIAGSFYYSRYLNLKIQIITLISFGLLGLISFNFVNFIRTRNREETLKE